MYKLVDSHGHVVAVRKTKEEAEQLISEGQYRSPFGKVTGPVQVINDNAGEEDD